MSNGDYDANGPLNAADAQWNYDGPLLIGRKNLVNALRTTVESFSAGIQARDYYQIVDRNLGATLFALYGKQTGPVGDIPMTPGARLNTINGEVFVFNEHAENRVLWTIDQLERIAQQVSGHAKVPDVDLIPSLGENPQTPAEYRAPLREVMKALHADVNAGKSKQNAELAAADVDVNSNDVRG